MAEIITFTNQKGGVGKTSLAMNFGVRLKMAGARVLFVDMDPQGNLTYTMGIDHAEVTVYDLLLGRRTAREAILHAAECDIIASSPGLSTFNLTQAGTGKEYLLRNALQPVTADYDFIVIDSPPTLGILTINILTAANSVMIPALADVFSLQGIGQLYTTIQTVQANSNPKLRIAGIVLSVVGMLLLRPVALMLGAEGEMLDYALRYGRVLMLSLPTFILQNMFQSFFVTAEKPHLGFYFTVGAGCTNMVLDVLLVGILHWSVEGAAIATMLSQVVGGLLPMFYFLNRKNTSLLHLCRPQFEAGVLLKACVNGSSELMTNLSMSLVNILYNYQLLRFAGEDGVAAYGVIMYASFLFVAVFVGYAVGSAPIVSYHYGANNRKEVNNLYRKSLKLIGVVAVVMTIGSMFIIPHVARFFVGYDENLLILTTRAFRLYGLSFLIMGFNVYASSFFTALGDGVTSALISFLRTLLFQLAVTAAELAALLVSIGLFITRDQQFHYRKAE